MVRGYTRLLRDSASVEEPVEQRSWRSAARLVAWLQIRRSGVTGCSEREDCKPSVVSRGF